MKTNIIINYYTTASGSTVYEKNGVIYSNAKNAPLFRATAGQVNALISSGNLSPLATI